MELEILYQSAKQAFTRRPPLLFLHGAYSNAKCWEPNFLPYFAEEGWDCYALSLRGHGSKEKEMWLFQAGLSDYLEDLQAAIAQLPQRPVLIGHSMGGYLVQKYLENHDAPGVILLNPTPPQGLWPIFFHLWWVRPLLIQQLLVWQQHPDAAPLEFWRNLIFSNRLPQSDLQKYQSLFQRESLRATLELYGQFIWRPNPKVPMLLVAGRHDVMVPAYVEVATARFHGIEPNFVDGSHALMLDPNWRETAQLMEDWLGDLSSDL